MDLKQYKVKIRNQLLNGLGEQAKREKAIAEGDYVTTERRPSSRTHYAIPKGNYDDLIRQMSVFRGPTISMPSHVTTNHDCGGGMDPREHQVGDHEVWSDDPTDVGGSFIGKKVMRKMMKKVKAIVEDDGESEVQGGKFNFVKSMKKLGKDAGKEAKSVANNVKNKGLQMVGNQAQQMLDDSLQSQTGGKFNLGKTMKHLGKSVGNEVKSVANTVKDEGVKALKSHAMQYMENTVAPMVGEEAMTYAPLLLAAGVQKKVKRTRKVSQKEANRHALIRKLMSQHKCSLAEASRHIKENNLSY